jgi:hypothetical protein
MFDVPGKIAVRPELFPVSAAHGNLLQVVGWADNFGEI